MKKSKSGIYKIHCSGNNRDYIGSAVNHIQRWHSHRSMLRNNKHNNRHLQNAYNKYGKDSFKYSLIEECDEKLLVEREQWWIDSYDFEELMNSSPTATTSTGFEHSEETIELIREKAIKRGEEGVAHLKPFHFKTGQESAFKGKKHTPENIEKFKEMAKNRTYETKFYGGWNKGIPMPDDVKLKVSESTSKNRRVYSDETEKLAQKLRSEGLSYQKIANKIGVSLAQTYRMCKGKRAEKKPIYLDN